MKWVGRGILRKEDPHLLRGEGRFVADLIPPDALHVAIVRSTHAHARIRGIRTGGALQVPGVTAVVTGADLPADLPPIPTRLTSQPHLHLCLQYPLARDRVRYVGEPVAAVIASDPYVAEDGAAAVEVDYEPLPPVRGLEEAAEPGAEVLFPELGTNEVAAFEVGPGIPPTVWDGADIHVEAEFSIGRHAAVPLEGRGVVAAYERARGLLTVWGPAKVPHFNRRILANLLGMPEHAIRFVEPDVGGGFGARGEFYPEDFLIPWLARRLPRPVAWMEDRRENLLACNHSRHQRHRVKLAARADGTLLGLQAEIAHDQGGYVRTHGVTVPDLGAALLPGPYRWEGYHAAVRCFVTNTTPTGTYRGPGRYEGTFVRERALDILARRLGLDPVELRRRNLITPEELPYDVGTLGLGVPTIYDSGDYPALLETALEAIHYEEARAWRRRARAEGRCLGIGVACFVEKSGFGPWEYARIEVDPSGEVVLFTGGSAVGQGMVTVLAQIVADELEIDPGRVRVVYGDTDRVPYGVGGFASRVTVVGGTAALQAAQAIRDTALRAAASILEADVHDLEFAEGRVRVRGAPARALDLGEVASWLTPGRAPAGLRELGPGLTAVRVWNTDHMTYPAGVHAAVVDVDPDTGRVTILDYAIAYDVGRAINPVLVDGQLQGGLAQGIGGALLEEFRYDDQAQALATTFMDYLLPTSLDVPAARIIIDERSPTPLNPLGAKGAGEGGSTGAGACIANAVSDALEPFGIEITRLPIHPSELREQIRQAQAARGRG